MRLLYTTEKYKKFNLRHATRQNSRRLRSKKLRVIKNRKESNTPKVVLKQNNVSKHEYRNYKIEHAPELFSLIQNPEEAIMFVKEIEKHYDKKRKVFVDLSQVKTIDYGAIIVLLSIMFKYKTAKIPFAGNYPYDQSAKELLKQSGFFEYLSYKKIKEADYYQIERSKDHNKIHTHAKKNVDAVLGAKIISQASELIWREIRRCPGVQRTLIELMLNTNNHADPNKQGEKHWWLSVNYEKQQNKACFSFIDLGVGIFTSLDNKKGGSKWYNWQQKLRKLFSFSNNVEVLKLIIDGDFHQTVTGKSYRGKGLPGIADSYRRNQLTNLKIITNDVYADIPTATYKHLGRSFTGTFIYWEVLSSNESFKGN